MASKSDESSHESKDGLVLLAASTVGGLAAATVARKTARLTWKAVTGEPPPDDPRSKDTDWMVAVLWAVASGAAIGVARLLVERQLSGRRS